MKIQACPLCRQVMLIPNDATITCGTCSFPMSRHTLNMTSESEMVKSERTMTFNRANMAT